MVPYLVQILCKGPLVYLDPIPIYWTYHLRLQVSDLMHCNVLPNVRHPLSPRGDNRRIRRRG